MTRRRRRRRKKLLDDLKDRRGNCQLKEEALDRTMWRNRFGRGSGPVVWQITDDDDNDDDDKPQEALTVSLHFSNKAVCADSTTKQTQVLAQRIPSEILCLLIYVCLVFQYINSCVFIVSYIFLSVTEIIR